MGKLLVFTTFESAIDKLLSDNDLEQNGMTDAHNRLSKINNSMNNLIEILDAKNPSIWSSVRETRTVVEQVCCVKDGDNQHSVYKGLDEDQDNRRQGGNEDDSDDLHYGHEGGDEDDNDDSDYGHKRGKPWHFVFETTSAALSPRTD